MAADYPLSPEQLNYAREAVSALAETLQTEEKDWTIFPRTEQDPSGRFNEADGFMIAYLGPVELDIKPNNSTPTTVEVAGKWVTTVSETDTPRFKQPLPMVEIPLDI